MDDQRWPTIKDLFFAALEREADDRESWLNQVCTGDPSLRAELDSLLSAHERAATFIERPAVIHASPELCAPEDAAAGQRIGGYRLVREIGAGGMGSVFFAVRADDAYHKEVAIKLVRGGVGSEVIFSRFQQERQILASLDHPNIARLLDGGTTEDGLPYFVPGF